jgi:hypothetical protein
MAGFWSGTLTKPKRGLRFKNRLGDRDNLSTRRLSAFEQPISREGENWGAAHWPRAGSARGWIVTFMGPQTALEVPAWVPPRKD